MNRVTVETAGPVMENLCRIEVADDYDSDTFYLDNADVETAREYGKADLLALIAENSGTARNILEAALVNESPVSLECRNLSSVVTGPHQTVVIGRVLAIHVADALVLDPARGHVDSPALGTIGRMHGAGWYTRTADRFQLDRPAWATRARD